MEKCIKYSLLFIILYGNLRANAQKEKTTLKTIIVETTTEEVTIITDIPQSDVQLALNHDVGKYTTMVFNYTNKQYETKIRYERCFDDYTKCLITQSVATPVCAVNDPYEIPDGFVTYNSYCDAYFDNCLRQMRFWRILGPGKCVFEGSYFTFIHRTRKRLGYQPRKYF